MTYFKDVKSICKGQSYKEFYSRTIGGKLSPFITAALNNTPITPNAVTISMIPLGIIGGYFLSSGTESGFVVGSACFIFLAILDCVDGELARFQKRTSNFGEYLDKVSHYMTNSALIFGFGLGLISYTNYSQVILFLTFLTNSALIGDDALRDLFLQVPSKNVDQESFSRKKEKSKTRLNFGIVGNIANIVFSNSGILYNLFFFSIFNYFFGWIGIMLIYFFFVASFTILKFFIRLSLIYSMRKAYE